MKKSTNNRVKKFIARKGGLTAILITIGLIIVALVLMALGYVYGSLNGNWDKFWVWFTEPFAISLYVIGFLVIFGLVIANILIKRNEDIK